MNADIITPRIDAEIYENFLAEYVDIDKQFKRAVSIRNNLIDAGVRNKKREAFNITRLIKAGVSKSVIIGEEMASKVYEFSNSDLVNNQLIKPNPFVITSLDVTVLNHLGEEIELSSRVTTNQIILYLNRVTIPDNQYWSLLVEK
jgi:hypothetical protein